MAGPLRQVAPDYDTWSSWAPEVREGFSLHASWLATARPNQVEPPGDWRSCLWVSGRGFGKTRCGAQAAAKRLLMQPGTRGLIAGPSFTDALDDTMESEAGLLSVIPPHLVRRWNRSKGDLYLTNGSYAKVIGADNPNKPRGKNSHFGWFDEFASYPKLKRFWKTAEYAIRLGDDPRIIGTSTPKPDPFLRQLMRRRGTVVIGGSTYENVANLSSKFLDDILVDEGTDWGEQEIHGKVVDFGAKSPFKRHWWRVWTELQLPKVRSVVLSLDTAYKDEEENDFTALTAWGVFDRPLGVEETRRRSRLGTASANVILLRAWREKLLFPDLRERALQEYDRFTFDGVPPELFLIEDKASGISLIQELHRKDIPVTPYNPGREPLDLRAHTSSHLLKDGLIWVPGKRVGDVRSNHQLPKWAESVVEECEEFPNGEHDDLVASSVQAWRYLRDYGELVASDEPANDDEDEDVRRADRMRAAPYG